MRNLKKFMMTNIKIKKKSVKKYLVYEPSQYLVYEPLRMKNDLFVISQMLRYVKANIAVGNCNVVFT